MFKHNPIQRIYQLYIERLNNLVFYDLNFIQSYIEPSPIK